MIDSFCYSLRRAWLDLRMGRCSGIPNCCIVWYVTGWRLIFGRLVCLHGKPAWRIRLITRYHEAAGHSGYVPCPLCLLSGSRIIRINRCTDKCGHVEESRSLVLEKVPSATFFEDL